jgi:hypothetical protein
LQQPVDTYICSPNAMHVIEMHELSAKPWAAHVAWLLPAPRSSEASKQPIPWSAQPVMLAAYMSHSRLGSFTKEEGSWPQGPRLMG